MNDTPSALVKSASRALDVLEFVTAATTPPSATEIGDQLRIPRSSLFYLLQTLTQRGYLVSEGSGGFVLGPSSGLLGNAAAVGDTLLPRVQTLIDEIGAALNETASYMERRGDEMECRLSRLADRPLLAVHRVGQRAPLYAFSGGKLVLADMSEQELDAYFERTQMVALTHHTLTSERHLRADIEEVRRTGFGVVREEHGDGIFAVSVPLRVRGRLVGTLGVAMATVRVNDVAVDLIKTTLGKAADKFQRLGAPKTGDG